MIKRGLSAFLLCFTVLIGIPNEAVAAGENIPFTSNHQVSLTSDVNGKVVPRGNITITVGNMSGAPNTVACNSNTSSSGDTCGYTLGLTLIKTPEIFSYDLAKNQGSCFRYDESPTQIMDFCNTFSEYGKANQSFGGIKADIQFIGKNTNLQAYKYLQFTFSTVGWPGGEYTLMAFSNAASYGAAKSNPLNFTLPAIPKTNIECTSPQSTYSGTAFRISCTSTLSLDSTPVNVIVAGSTSKDVLGGTIANGNRFEIPDVKIESVGVAKLQVSIPTIIDTLQSSTSNVMAIQVAAPLIIPNLSLTLSKSEVTKPSVATVSSDLQALPIKLQTSQKIDGPWVDVASGVTGAKPISVTAPVGTWVRAHFLGTGQVKEQFSDPVQVLLTPTVKCDFPKSIKSDEYFTVNCSSNISLPNFPLSLDYKNADDEWQSLSKILVKGSIGAIKFKVDGRGSYTFRTSSMGGGNYSEFQSNSASIAIVQTSNSNSSTSSTSRPKGKVDKSSNAYKLMYSVGANFAKVSFANDSGSGQCSSARTRGIINAQGRPQYLGAQARMIQSYLNTASGFQGCLDGFGK
jgi:hypothetical protein